MVQDRPDRVERRLSAILAADVAGYSRLMHSDEEATHAKLTALLADAVDPAIAEHRGRVVKKTGDGFLAEFSSAVEAVRAALQFQNHVQEITVGDLEDNRIAFRVGINICDVIVEPHDIFGDGVNIAARLESIAEPGGICISSSAYEHVRGKVGAEFSDIGEQQLKNIARPVRAYALVRQRVGAKSNHSMLDAASPPHLSIVVLPFTNIGGDPEQEYFVDGVTESLTTDLSRIAGSFVIARNTAFTFKGKNLDARQVGQELNVHYLLEGSVQRSGNRLRINVQLVNAETGTHLWAERFDKPVADLFDMQDEIIAGLANTLNAQLTEEEARRAERSPHPSSMELHFRGKALLSKGWTPESLAQARGFFERALALDPQNIEAMVWTAIVDLIAGSAYMSYDRAGRLAAAEATLLKVLSFAPNHAYADLVLGGVLISSNRAAQGMAECQRALALDRNLAEAHGLIGDAKYFMGRAAETEAHFNEARRLSPRDIFAFRWLVMAGFAKLQLEADAEAAGLFRQGIEANRNYPLTHFALAAALALLGSLDQARAAAKAGLAVDPSFTVRRFCDGASSDNPTFLAKRERVYQGMRMAGVPEG
jgi:TolB-like protein/class 3 adenylate cyclase